MINYVRKRFNKEDLSSGQLIELFNTKTKDYEMFLVSVAKTKSNSKLIFINQSGGGFTIDQLTSNLKLNDSGYIITKVYSQIDWFKLTERSIACKSVNRIMCDMYSAKYRQLIYKKEVAFLTERELLEMLVKQIDKEIVLI